MHTITFGTGVRLNTHGSTHKGLSGFLAIQRNYLLDEFSTDAAAHGVGKSVHIQVGAADAWDAAQWVQSVADVDP